MRVPAYATALPTCPDKHMCALLLNNTQQVSCSVPLNVLCELSCLSAFGVVSSAHRARGLSCLCLSCQQTSCADTSSCAQCSNAPLSYADVILVGVIPSVLY